MPIYLQCESICKYDISYHMRMLHTRMRMRMMMNMPALTAIMIRTASDNNDQYCGRIKHTTCGRCTMMISAARYNNVQWGRKSIYEQNSSKGYEDQWQCCNKSWSYHLYNTYINFITHTSTHCSLNPMMMCAQGKIK